MEIEDEVALQLVMKSMSKVAKIEQMKSAAKHQEQLIGTVSHELRTPLNLVMQML